MTRRISMYYYQVAMCADNAATTASTIMIISTATHYALCIYLVIQKRLITEQHSFAKSTQTVFTKSIQQEPWPTKESPIIIWALVLITFNWNGSPEASRYSLARKGSQVEILEKKLSMVHITHSSVDYDLGCGQWLVQVGEIQWNCVKLTWCSPVEN